MPENPHEKEKLTESEEKPSAKQEKSDKNGAWSEDQKKRGYYYDDACGYEIYDADEEEKEEDGTAF
jgi:hypothetical protein